MENEIFNTPIRSKKKNNYLIKELFFIVIVVFLFIVALLIYTHMLPTQLWQKLLPFWPVIIIFVGLRLIIGVSKKATLFMAALTLITLLSMYLSSLAAISPGFKNEITKLLPHLLPKNSMQAVVLQTDKTATDRKVTIAVNNYMLSDTLLPHVVQTEITKISDKKAVMYTTFKNQVTIAIANNFANADLFTISIGEPELSTSFALTTGASGKIALSYTNIATFSLTNNKNTSVELQTKSLPKKNFSVTNLAGVTTIRLPKNTGVVTQYATTNAGKVLFNTEKLTGNGVYTPDDYTNSQKQLTLHVKVEDGTVAIQTAN